MFAKTILLFIAAVTFLTFSEGFSTQNRIVSRRSTIKMMWDTKKMGGANAGTIKQKKIAVHEEETIKDFFRRVPLGTGSDDRFPTYPKEKEQEMEHAQLSRIDQSLRQKSLKMALEGKYHGVFGKMALISRAVHEGTLAKSSTIGASMSAGGLLKDWDMDI